MDQYNRIILGLELPSPKSQGVPGRLHHHRRGDCQPHDYFGGKSIIVGLAGWQPPARRNTTHDTAELAMLLQQLLQQQLGGIMGSIPPSRRYDVCDNSKPIIML